MLKEDNSKDLTQFEENASAEIRDWKERNNTNNKLEVESQAAEKKRELLEFISRKGTDVPGPRQDLENQDNINWIWEAIGAGRVEMPLDMLNNFKKYYLGDN